MENENNRQIVTKVNDVILKLTKAMPDFIKIDQGNNYQAAKRARQTIMGIEKNDLPELKKDIKKARVARDYKKPINQ